MSDEDLESLALRMNKDQVRMSGFISGLLRVRGDLGFEEGRSPDPFMEGYKQGEKARDEIVAEAVGLFREAAGHDFDVPAVGGLPAPESTFAADTRLLGYFGALHRAARVVHRSRGAQGYDDLTAALALPPDIKAAVEGPRGQNAPPRFVECGSRHPDSHNRGLITCEKAKGHEGEHGSTDTITGGYLTWPA